MENATEAQRLATEAVITSLEASGIEVVEASDAMAEAVMGMGGVEMSAKKKRALETVSVQETEHQQTAISSADGAKVLNNLDNLAEEYDKNPKTEEKTFIGVVADALGIEAQGKSSKYVTFETKNGKVVTIRLSNHNATVSNFDNNGEADGISIVVSAKGNNGMTNDGDAHVVEHYYDAIKLRRAEGKPLADIVRSIKQALYSGEFTDTTGLAERQEVNLNEVETLRTPQGVVYGWTDGKKVYLTKEGMNPETPIHEYTHLWARAMMQGNAEGWQSVKDLLRGTPVWNEVMSDANYADIHGDEDAVASECLSRLSGRENAKRMEAEARKMIDEAKGVFAKADAVTLVERMKKALQEFWSWVGKNLFDIKSFGSIEEVTDRVLYDLIHNSQFIMHNSELPGIEKQIIGESGASALDKADEATHRMDNLGVAREMEADGKDAKAIRMATGWERGADGKWRYEIGDYSIKEEKIDFITNQLDHKNTATIILKDLLEDAQGLFAAYPELRNMRVVIKKDSSVIGQGKLQWYDAVYDRQIVLNEAAIISHFAKSALERYGKADVGIIRIKQGYDPTTKEKFTNEADKQEALKTYIEMMNEALLDYHRFKSKNKDIATSILTHEIQHAIQFIEGFARGSSPKEFADVRGAVIDSIDFMTNGDLLKGNSISNSQSLRDALNKKIPYTNISLKEGYIDNLQKVARKYGYDNIDALVDDFEKMPSAFEQYHRTAGEVEARNASARMGMSADERRATLLSETEDVAREDQIFLMENSDEAKLTIGGIDLGKVKATSNGRKVIATTRSGHNQIFKSVHKYAIEKFGAENVEYEKAKSGSIYMTVDLPNGHYVEIRFASHTPSGFSAGEIETNAGTKGIGWSAINGSVGAKVDISFNTMTSDDLQAFLDLMNEYAENGFPQEIVESLQSYRVKPNEVSEALGISVDTLAEGGELYSDGDGIEAVMVDNQGNPIDEDGKLIVEQVSSIDEITDADFDSPTRSIQLPSIPPKVDEAIGANGKPIVIKKNVFEKNKKSHKDLTPKDSRAILINTLYSPDLYGQNQKITRPYNWILIHLADTNTAVLVEVNENKDNVEIVNWHYINDDAIERKKKQAIREGGLILTLESAAADTSNFLPSADKGNNNNSEKQENNESNGSDGSTNAERL